MYNTRKEQSTLSIFSVLSCKCAFKWCVVLSNGCRSAAWKSRNRESLYKHYVTMHQSGQVSFRCKQQRRLGCTRSWRITLGFIVSVGLSPRRRSRWRGRDACIVRSSARACDVGVDPILLSRTAFPDIHTRVRARIFLVCIFLGCISSFSLPRRMNEAE